MDTLSWSMQSESNQTRVQMSGAITEEFDYGPLVDGSKRLVLDLGEISRINSGGTRVWCDFMNALTNHGTAVSLERCSVPIVYQMNFVPAFSRGADVRSVLAPFRCDQCHHEFTAMLPLEKATPGLEARPCPQCQKQADFDDLPEIFFSFRRP